jgi:type IV fimbrial biogenesis protein FimT
MQFPRSKRTNAGFTLVELIITLVIATVLVVVGVPSMRSFIQDSRIITASNELITALNYARSAAIKRFTEVTLCPSDDGATCTATDWESGWLVFLDGDTQGEVDADDEIIRIQQALEGGLTLTLADINFVLFRPNGTLVAACEGCADETTLGQPREHWIARLLWSLVPINDAMAAPPGGGGPPDGGDDYTAGCSSQDVSDNVNSEKVINMGLCDGKGGGFAGSVAALFLLCDGSDEGETGRAIGVSWTGRINTMEIACK